MAATITKGYTFGASELVTNTKLHTLVDDASIRDIVASEIDALDTDGALTANSDSKIPSQRAVKTYANTIATSSIVCYENDTVAYENNIVYY